MDVLIVLIGLILLIYIVRRHWNYYGPIVKGEHFPRAKKKSTYSSSEKEAEIQGREILYYQKLARDISAPQRDTTQASKKKVISKIDGLEPNKVQLGQESEWLKSEQARLQAEEERLQAMRLQIEQREREAESQIAFDSSHRYVVATGSSAPSMNTGISEIDGPGMYQRLTGLGPQGHVVYLMYSEVHGAYKVGHCPPGYLGTRLRQIRATVPDVVLAGTAVFSSRQRAFDAEQEVLNNNRNHRYRGISGGQSGGTEWLTRRPSQRRPAFTSPTAVERRYQEGVDAPLAPIDVPDLYTVYLVYSSSKNAYKAKWCKTENLTVRLAKLQEEEAADSKILSRFKVEQPHKARAIAKEFNVQAGAYERVGRRDIVNWVENPVYLNEFTNWDRDGNRIDR